MATKGLNITRNARGKLTDNAADKEFDNLTKQIEDKFNGILNKLNSFDIRNTTELRKIDLETATMAQIVNNFSTLIKDLKEILST